MGKQLMILSPTFKSKYLAVSFEDSIKSNFFNLISLGLPVDPEVLVKIKELVEIRKKQNLNFDIEIDGGINFENYKLAIEAGANILVSGTTVFKSNDGNIKKNIDLLRAV